ncbi:ras-related protein Rab-44 isoform X4 [Arvicanthis niloticus]|uniref:ras-related protein Rab-44 isoform X4 n=1 Tax=Arvicanthis niloticus TaxID=61156 RepID=UPI00402BDBC8
MEKGKGVSRKGRKLASSRRRQAREPADGQDALVAAPEAESWPSDADAELQGFFQDCGAKERGFVTREDLAEARFSFLGGKEPQMIFDWVDVESRGCLSMEEFSSGLKNVFGSSPGTHRLRTKRSLPSQRLSVTSNFPVLEEADAEEKEAFLALVGQMETGHSFSEFPCSRQAEIWKLWRELRQEEPQLAGNLEGFLAKMSSRLQEARADREALAWTLRKRDSDHLHKVRQLYEETEEQIRREKQQLQAQSDSRDMALSAHMQEALEAKEEEVRRLAEGQKELEAQLLHLSSTQQEASWENLQLREAERDLAGQLEEVERKSGTPQPREPGAESRLEDPRTDLREAEQSSSPGDRTDAKPQADPDYLYHVIFLGDSNVGKTSFLHLLHHDAFATGLTATVGVDFRVKNLQVDNKTFALQLWDTAGQERYHSLTRQLLRKAEGVVLMYDVTSQESFTHVRYWLDCLQDAGVEGVAMVLLGNKMDCEEKRQVPTEAGRRLAQELGVSFGECSAALGHNILEPMMNLARSLKMQEDRLKASLVEVTRPQPPKRAGCCP